MNQLEASRDRFQLRPCQTKCNEQNFSIPWPFFEPAQKLCSIKYVLSSHFSPNEIISRSIKKRTSFYSQLNSQLRCNQLIGKWEKPNISEKPQSSPKIPTVNYRKSNSNLINSCLIVHWIL